MAFSNSFWGTSASVDGSRLVPEPNNFGVVTGQTSPPQVPLTRTVSHDQAVIFAYVSVDGI